MVLDWPLKPKPLGSGNSKVCSRHRSASIVKNAIRIFTLSALEMYVFPGIFGSTLHHRGGIIFFLMGLAVLAELVPVLYRLRYLEDRSLSTCRSHFPVLRDDAFGVPELRR